MSTCETCRFRNPDLREEYKLNGSCRRFPPQVSQWTHPDYSGPQYDQHWPYVGPSDWCGEYAAKEQKS